MDGAQYIYRSDGVACSGRPGCLTEVLALASYAARKRRRQYQQHLDDHADEDDVDVAVSKVKGVSGKDKRGMALLIVLCEL